MGKITNGKGDTGVGFVIADLISNGMHIALPISQHLPWDCIVVDPIGRTSRLSVKYRSVTRKGTIEVPFRSVWSNGKGAHAVTHDKDEFDATAIYCPETKKCYYVRNDETMGVKIAMALRVTPSKIKIGTVNSASDYEGCSRLWK